MGFLRKLQQWRSTGMDFELKTYSGKFHHMQITIIMQIRASSLLGECKMNVCFYGDELTCSMEMVEVVAGGWWAPVCVLTCVGSCRQLGQGGVPLSVEVSPGFCIVLWCLCRVASLQSVNTAHLRAQNSTSWLS